MERLSDVCRKLGVSRRVLQELDKLNIARHSDETEGGYWLYSEEDIRKVAIAILFSEAGYKRGEIKIIMGLSYQKQKILRKKMVRDLEKKQRWIEWLKSLSKVEE